MFARPGAGTTDPQRALVARERHKHKTNGAGWRTRHRARPTRPHAPRGASSATTAEPPAANRARAQPANARGDRGGARGESEGRSAQQRRPAPAAGNRPRRRAGRGVLYRRSHTAAITAKQRSDAAAPRPPQTGRPQRVEGHPPRLPRPPEASGSGQARQRPCAADRGGAERSTGRPQRRFQLILNGITLPHREKTL